MNSTDPDDIYRLTSHRLVKGYPFKNFWPSERSSFNVCWFVEFEPLSGPKEKPTRWVVRIPVPSRVPLPDELVKVEVATLKLGYPDACCFLYKDIHC